MSIGLTDADVEFLDAYARSQGIDSRSAVLQRAVRLLRANQLTDAYEDAWRDWAASGEADAWDTAIGDGLLGNASG